MLLSDFDYHLPPELIAQTPVEPRDSSRLLMLDRDTGALQHCFFRDLPQWLRAGDVLVFNDTRVLHARVPVRKASGGKAELLLLRSQDVHTWVALGGGKGLRPGVRLTLEQAPTVSAEIVAELDGPERLVRFSEPILPRLVEAGQVPLPPYIHERLADPERYQTVYARAAGSAAAPTAGLHFTPALLATLTAMGIALVFVTLHVGVDTFQPVHEDDPRMHKMHGEWCAVSPEAAAAINAAKRDGRRVIAVGTTAVRTLESAALRAAPGEAVSAFADTVDLFIYPGFRWRVVDGLITNFHLPRSTLLMLVSALAGRERLLKAYAAAVDARYRFYSFGDAMMIVSAAGPG
jgi:S-adenosylmethionine:tRNA ribosyltransferase-isomerase